MTKSVCMNHFCYRVWLGEYGFG